ncbi:hypothetical protein J2I47_04620 [Fibrella sp. HMF5335]|uniref:WD40 repeat domain-containing protein n=2 Tax=Fibrella rubiginis TaxID=2817060 RepID=A0A939GBH7_9BACT|nr:hypothetical protein [Fibrella rubiginis]MBO0935824.1 hypothetical protein [Fibrella rubiginis]
MLTTASDSTITVWGQNGQRLYTLFMPDLMYSAIASPSAKWVLTRSHGGKTAVWNENGKPLCVLPQGSINSAVFSRDGSRLLTTSATDKPTVWDSSGKFLLKLPYNKYRDFVTSAVFSPSQSLILTSSIYTEDNYLDVNRDGTVTIWDWNGKRIKAFRVPGLVNSANFSPDGQQIITVADHKAVTVWDHTGKQLYTLPIQGSVSSAVFSPDGNWIATDSNKVLWLTPEGALNWLKKNPGKVAPLSAEIREAYGVPVR